MRVVDSPARYLISLIIYGDVILKQVPADINDNLARKHSLISLIVNKTGHQFTFGETIKMNIQLQIDEKLLQEALELGQHQSQQILIEEALREYIQRRKQVNILDLFGTIEYDDNYDYKQQRQLP